MGNHFKYHSLDISEINEKLCRICFENANEKLISPCLCKGTSKYIHEECLKQWLRYQSDTIFGSKCEICHHVYSIEINSSKKLRLILNKSICTTILFYFITLFFALILALIPIVYRNLFPYNAIVSIFLTLASFFFFIVGITATCLTLGKIFNIEKSYSWGIENYQEQKNRASLIYKLIGLP
ncbi:hypothetical protein SteCoe_10370 [Stentor coeruleus]|uniref:RING-CH-type domain-containing protein n=1 Tax=Stentor coeruleus TaxID=5963 RepID=A0A1R2CFL3_9CILI|nr:hypothetical protein SteCoe_10370 [Stentor coeruleus]